MQIITKEELQNAAIVAVQEKEYINFKDCFDYFSPILPVGCVVLLLKDGQTIETLSEEQMREAGWQRICKP